MNYLITKFEKWLLRRICRRIVLQSDVHKQNIAEYYSIIHDAASNEFTEDNHLQLQRFMHDCFIDSQLNTTRNHTLISSSTIYDDLNLSLDWNVVDAIKQYFLLGLSPGSFTTNLLKGDYETAKAHAHPLILPWFSDHIKFVEILPECCRGENVETWKGACYMQNEDITSIVLTDGIAAKWYKELKGN